MSRRAFSLIELLVVIGIIGLLTGLLMAAIQKTRDSAYRVECLNRMKQIGLALQNYHAEFYQFPPGCSFRNGKDQYPHMSWNTRLLPYLG